MPLLTGWTAKHAERPTRSTAQQLTSSPAHQLTTGSNDAPQRHKHAERWTTKHAERPTG